MTYRSQLENTSVQRLTNGHANKTAHQLRETEESLIVKCTSIRETLTNAQHNNVETMTCSLIFNKT